MENTKKSFGEIWCSLTTEQSEYLKHFINRQRKDAVEYYKSQQLPIADVSQRSELLPAFLEKTNDGIITLKTAGTDISLDWQEYLKAVNCG